MAQENWSHTSISIYKVECSVYKYTEYYRPAKIHPLYSILSKVNSIHFFYPHFVCRYNIISYLDHLLKLLYLLCFNPLFLEKTLCRIYHCYIAILSVIYFQSQIIFHCLHHLMWDIFLCKLSEIVFSRYICTVYLTILSNPVER